MIKYFFKQFLFHFLGYFFDSQLNCPCDALPTKTRGQTGKRLSVPGLLRIPLVGNFVLLSQKKNLLKRKPCGKILFRNEFWKKNRNEIFEEKIHRIGSVNQIAIMRWSGSEWVRTQNKDEFRPWKQLKRSRIWQIYHGRRYDQWWSGEACQIAEKGKQSLGHIWR